MRRGQAERKGLIAKLWGDVWRYRPGLWAGLRTALQLFSLPAVVVNGRVVSVRGQPLDPDAFRHMIQTQLESGESPAGGLQKGRKRRPQRR